MNDFKSVVKKLSSVFFCKLSRSHPAAYREMPPVAYNIPCFQNMGFIGDQFAYRVADDLNKYYTQFPCMGTPK